MYIRNNFNCKKFIHCRNKLYREKEKSCQLFYGCLLVHISMSSRPPWHSATWSNVKSACKQSARPCCHQFRCLLRKFTEHFANNQSFQTCHTNNMEKKLK